MRQIVDLLYAGSNPVEYLEINRKEMKHKMKFNSQDEVKEFLSIVDSCTGDVVLSSKYGDRYNLKSTLTQYVAIGALLGNRGDELELFCSNKEDEAKFFEFFHKNPNVLA